MKNLFLLIAILLSLSLTGKDSDCDNISKIIKDPSFDRCFQISKKRGDIVTIYIAKSSGLKVCGPFNHPSGQRILFAKADFEIKIDNTSRKGVVNPRLVVWKEKNKYHFFETETNLKLSASVKNGKVVDISLGIF